VADRHQVVLDTDIGSDVDDALALAMLLGSPEVDVLGVTTVYGDVDVRAQIARRLARLAGHDELVVVPGAERPLSGEEAWWAGFEGRLYPDLARETFVEDMSAAEFLVETVTARPGQVDVVAIGPLTNLAEAIRADSAFVRSIRHLYVMGGRFDAPEAEHNFRSDSIAAAEVFASGMPTTVVGLEITTQARIGPSHLARIGAAGALGRQLEAEVRQWWEYTRKQWNHPHDPLAVLAMLRPDLMVVEATRVHVERAGPQAGVSVAEKEAGERAEDGAVTHVVREVDVDAAVEETVARIEAAGRRGAS
jgi:purine nucleosidase